MNLSQLVLILKARWRLIVSGLVLGLGVAVLASVLATKNYTAAAQVLVNVRAPTAVSIVGDPGVTPQLQPDYLSTQVDVVKSDRVAEEAVRRLGLTDDPQSMRDYRASGSSVPPARFFAAQISGGLKVVPSSSSRVISIIYTSRNPQTAAAVANAFADAYRTVSIDLQREPERQAATWYTQSVDELSKRLAQAQAKLSARRAELGVTAPQEGPDADDARLAALSQQLAAAQASQAVQNARAGNGALPDATTNPVLQSLDSDIARLEAQRRQLATFAGPNNVDYQQLSNQLAGLRAERAKQQALVARSAAASSAQSNSSVAQLQSDVDKQRGRVIASQRARGEIASLEQDVTNLKSTYEQVVARRSQSNLLSQSDQTNVLLLSPATEPTGPSGLPWPMKVVVGVILGTLAGLGLALALEFLDQRMRTPEDAAVWLEIPNLGGVRSLEAPAQGLLGYSTRRYLPRQGERDA